MLRIIRGRSSTGSGCVLSDFGASSFDDTVSDRDTLSDCSVRYFCESASVSLENVTQPCAVTSSNSSRKNMESQNNDRANTDMDYDGLERDRIELGDGIDNLMSTSMNNEDSLINSCSFKHGE